MSIPRQIKVHTGPSSGDFFTDSLGNNYSLSVSSGGVFGNVQVYYCPSGGGLTGGGPLTYRGVSFDAPVLADALIIAIVFYRDEVESRLVLMEFGATTASDPTASGEDLDNAHSSSTTSHQHAAGPIPSTSTLGQVWIAANISRTSVSASTPSGFTAFAFNDGLERAYWRIDTTPLDDHTVPFTTDTATDVAGLLTHFDDVAAPASLEIAPPVLPVPTPTAAAPQTPCSPQSGKSGGGIGNAGCNVGGVGVEVPPPCC